MIECYYRWCEYHEKDEPFCCETHCRATKVQLSQFACLRKVEKIGWESKDQSGIENS